MGWTFVYLMVFLKLPIIALLLLVWWTTRPGPEHDSEQDGGDDDGGSRVPRHPRPPLRPLPRRGPHRGNPTPASPARVRAVARVRSGVS
ncbi:MAG: hypothetical protein U0S48_09450 [Solirubrobacteraceae bacterium]